MNIFLTHGYFLWEDEKEQRIMKPYPPLGLQCIAAYLEAFGFDSELFDTTFSSFEALRARLLEQKPDLLGIYTNLMTKVNVLRIMRWVKEEPTLAHCKILLGGPEVRHHHLKFLEHGADFVALGEGEETILELARYLSGNAEFPLSQITGLIYKSSEGEIIHTGERPLVKNLDELPFPARHKIDYPAYFDVWKEHHGYSMISINTMRGCPYGCKWCSRAVYGESYRRRSPAKVVEEIRQLCENYAFDKIWFVDDVFTINHRWLREFARLVLESGRIIPYEVITRADRMNTEVVELLKASGCFRVWIGAESGSQTVLDAMNRMVKIEKVKEAIYLAQGAGIEAGTFIMLGYPGETEKDILATVDYLKDANPDQFTLTVAYPIKGTPFYEEVEDHFIEELPWETTTDRDIDFKRPYTRKYYDHAMNWVIHEVASHRAPFLQSAFLRAKWRAMKSRAGMYLERWRMGHINI